MSPMERLELDSFSKLISGIVDQLLATFAGRELKADDLAISIIDLTDSAESIDFRGEEPIYPASIIKLFYLVAVHQWLEDNKISDGNELKRACKDMIVDSSNDATHYIVDVLTGTTAGPELPPQEMAIWAEKRNAINKYFQELGYKNININQKTWGDGPFGRERVYLGKNFENRNKLTTNATAKLLSEIVSGKCVSKERSQAMLGLLARDFIAESENLTANPDNQAIGFMGSALPAGARLWSKAGWMSTARHDAAYIELPNKIRFVLVVFLSNHAKEYGILPAICHKVIEALNHRHKQ